MHWHLGLVTFLQKDPITLGYSGCMHPAGIVLGGLARDPSSAYFRQEITYLSRENGALEATPDCVASAWPQTKRPGATGWPGRAELPTASAPPPSKVRCSATQLAVVVSVVAIALSCRTFSKEMRPSRAATATASSFECAPSLVRMLLM